MNKTNNYSNKRTDEREQLHLIEMFLASEHPLFFFFFFAYLRLLIVRKKNVIYWIFQKQVIASLNYINNCFVVHVLYEKRKIFLKFSTSFFLLSLFLSFTFTALCFSFLALFILFNPLLFLRIKLK